MLGFRLFLRTSTESKPLTTSMQTVVYFASKSLITCEEKDVYVESASLTTYADKDALCSFQTFDYV